MDQNNKPHLFATHITDNFLDIFKNILKLNALNGFFVENYALLEVIHETYTKTQDNDNKTKFNEFYFSDEVKPHIDKTPLFHRHLRQQ